MLTDDNLQSLFVFVKGVELCFDALVANNIKSFQNERDIGEGKLKHILDFAENRAVSEHLLIFVEEGFLFGIVFFGFFVCHYNDKFYL